jgi:hypothetical protein
VPSILFDESHGELLCSQNVHHDREMDTWTRLRRHLGQLKFDIASYPTEESVSLAEELAKHDVLVLGAPTVPRLSLSDLSAIRDFVESGIKRLKVVEPAYFDRTNEWPYSVARLPDTQYTFAAAVEFGTGRMVALGDFVLLSDQHITHHDNLAFVSNLFRWLTFTNSIDCHDAHIEPEIRLGVGATFSITLGNPYSISLERLRCTRSPMLERKLLSQ